MTTRNRWRLWAVALGFVLGDGAVAEKALAQAGGGGEIQQTLPQGLGSQTPGSQTSRLGTAPGTDQGPFGVQPGQDQPLMGAGGGTSIPRVPASISSPDAGPTPRPRAIGAPEALPIPRAQLYGSLSMPDGDEEIGRAHV